jgi:lipopolysaccharide transport protein LptA
MARFHGALFGMKMKLNSAGLVLSVFMALFFSGARGLAQQNAISHASDFKSEEYFDAPHQQQMKSRLSGAEAQPLAGGLLVIEKLKLEMFELDGKTNFIVEAPECVYDTQNETANSAGHLQLRTGDGKFHVEGDGFLWRQTSQFLTISNDVKTLIMTLITTAGISATAQTNAMLPMPRDPTRIVSDSADFDMAGHKAVYHGHVRVDDPQMKLTCAQLVVDLPPAGGRVSHIVAETNVVIDLVDEKGQTNHATSGNAVYDYNVRGAVTNETVTLTGNPQIVNGQGTNTADVITWDRANGHVRETNPHMSGQNLDGTGADTNSLPVPKLF